MDILIYIAKLIFCSAIIYVGYYILLSKTILFQWNRYFLLTGTLFSILLPLLKIPQSLKPIHQFEILNVGPMAFTTSTDKGISIEVIILILYFIPVVLLLIQMFFKLFVIRKMIKNSKVKRIGSTKLYLTESSNAPFSFFNIIFWKKNIDPASYLGQCAMNHELAHVKTVAKPLN